MRKYLEADLSGEGADCIVWLIIECSLCCRRDVFFWCLAGRDWFRGAWRFGDVKFAKFGSRRLEGVGSHDCFWVTNSVEILLVLCAKLRALIEGESTYRSFSPDSVEQPRMKK